MARPIAVGSNRTDSELFSELYADVRREAQRGFDVEVGTGGPHTLTWHMPGASESCTVDIGELRRDGVWAVRERIMAQIAKWRRQRSSS